MSAYWIIEIRDSDGNDCTVYDAVREGKTAEEAVESLCAELEAAVPGLEADGGFGYYYPCNCEETTDCGGHGGITVGDPTLPAGVEGPFGTEEEAESHCVPYHSRY